MRPYPFAGQWVAAATGHVATFQIRVKRITSQSHLCSGGLSAAERASADGAISSAASGTEALSRLSLRIVIFIGWGALLRL